MPYKAQHTRFILAILFVLFGHIVHSHEFPTNYSWGAIEAEKDPAERLKKLAEAARFNNLLVGNYSHSDSLCFYALDFANSLQNDELKKFALEIFFDNADLVTHKSVAVELTEQLINSENIRDQWLGRIYLSDVLGQNYQDSMGLIEANAAVKLATQMGDSIAKNIAFFNRAAHLEILPGRKADALTNFLKAKEAFEHFEKDVLFVNLCTILANFYTLADAPEKARIHLEEATRVYANSEEVDSIHALDINFLNYYADFIDPNKAVDENEIIALIEFTIKRNYNVLKRHYLGIYRTFLISSEDYEGLYNVYQVNFPQEFLLIKERGGEIYYRMKAYFKEYLGDLDSARYYWNFVVKLSQEVSDKNRKANLYVRYAEFLQRTGETYGAIEYYHMAHDTAVSINSSNYMYKAAIGLDSMYRFKGDYVRAYKWRKKATEVKAIIDKDNQEEKLLLTQVIFNAEKAKEKQELKMKSVQRGFIGVIMGLILVLILSFVIYYQFRQTKKEKQRSDELLLNILPAETAAELKEKGRTSARRYNDVTIVFADIVGFSKVAETLEPNDLVEEIDRYFRAFDDLTRIYGLEKIKTIGDAYVAVSGLPQGNTSTAKDAIKLALSMQRVVKELNEEKENTPFDLRIGLNTGDVVAGVVGSRKFQFDIWGDAVNIAARMEQNGKANKVNVSQSTYQLTKDEFQFTYRGKVGAKNKGELDMYFVDV